MVNLFRPKTMRRMAVFMALVAPIVYLFGSLFFALNGAHGQEVFAEPVYFQDYVDVDEYSDGDPSEYRIVVDDPSSFQSYIYSFLGSTGSGDVYLQFYFLGNLCRRFYVYGGALAVFENVHSNDGFNATIYRNSAVNPPYYAPWYFVPNRLSDIVPLSGGGQLQKLVSVPSSNVPENSGAYSDYIFKNFFAKDNFLVEWGNDAISEAPHGFAPFGAFWRYLDTNVLHLSNDQVGLMAYGYMYYAAHVLLFDVGFMLVTFFLSFIQKVGDKIGGEER